MYSARDRDCKSYQEIRILNESLAGTRFFDCEIIRYFDRTNFCRLPQVIKCDVIVEILFFKQKYIQTSVFLANFYLLLIN